MEYASLLAGERWSDHPRCTHPLLGGVARAVNDRTSDEARASLVRMIPSVIGLHGDDPRVDIGIALRCAAMALPVAAEYRQRALVVGILAGRRVLAVLEDGGPSAIDLSGPLEHTRRALIRAPHCVPWAEEYVAANEPDAQSFQRRSAPAVVRVAVDGIAEACIPDPDGLLYGLLASVVGDCTSWLGSGSCQTAAEPTLTGVVN